ncbi:hypothetical protein KKF84_10675 [Myxococcota bacterium]|nr:hypothetical protein [Myxococcota bacterium]
MSENKEEQFDHLFHKLEEKSGSPLYSTLDSIFSTFNTSFQVRKENHLDALKEVLLNPLTEKEYKVKIIDFVKSSCIPHGRLNASVRLSALDEKEIMKVRWAAFDALKESNPEFCEQLKVISELTDRDLDPEKSALDIQDARIQYAKEQSKTVIWWFIAPFLIFASMAVLYFTWNRPIFLPSVGVLLGISVLLVTIWLISMKRCPSCKKLNARGKLILRDSYQGPRTPMGSTTMGSSPVSVRNKINVYSTICKYCKHEWIVLR